MQHDTRINIITLKYTSLRILDIQLIFLYNCAPKMYITSHQKEVTGIWQEHSSVN